MDVQKDPEGIESRYVFEYADIEAKRVLEVGCGDGRLTWRYAKAAKRVAGIDLEQDDLRVARIERPTDLETRVTFARADSTHLPFRADSFDLAIFAWSF